MLNLFSRLFRWMSASDYSHLPLFKSFVPGFTITVERKEGCLLRSRPNESSDDTPFEDAAVDWHMEVTVTYDGTNPNYPGPRGPWKAYLTQALSHKQGMGMSGNVHFCRPGERFTRISVYEEFEDYRTVETFGNAILIPDHLVWLKMSIADEQEETMSSSLGLTSRNEHKSISMRSTGRGTCG